MTTLVFLVARMCVQFLRLLLVCLDERLHCALHEQYVFYFVTRLFLFVSRDVLFNVYLFFVFC